jgi:hypothetical protein
VDHFQKHIGYTGKDLTVVWSISLNFTDKETEIPRGYVCSTAILLSKTGAWMAPDPAVLNFHAYELHMFAFKTSLKLDLLSNKYMASYVDSHSPS